MATIAVIGTVIGSWLQHHFATSRAKAESQGQRLREWAAIAARVEILLSDADPGRRTLGAAEGLHGCHARGASGIGVGASKRGWGRSAASLAYDMPLWPRAAPRRMIVALIGPQLARGRT